MPNCDYISPSTDNSEKIYLWVPILKTINLNLSVWKEKNAKRIEINEKNEIEAKTLQNEVQTFRGTQQKLSFFWVNFFSTILILFLHFLRNLAPPETKSFLYHRMEHLVSHCCIIFRPRLSSLPSWWPLASGGFCHSFKIKTGRVIKMMEQHDLKNVNNCRNTNIYSYLDDIWW
jgi:hypothetical protein